MLFKGSLLDPPHAALQVQKLAEVSVLKGDIAKQEDVLNVMQQARGWADGWDGQEVEAPNNIK